MIRLGLFGADGRLGRRARACLPDHPELDLVRSVVRDTPRNERFDDCDVVLDVSAAGATDDLLSRLAGTEAALVSGVTGRTEAQQLAVTERAKVGAVFETANFSVGVSILRQLVADAARAFGADAEVEVLELHHRAKVDAPSGTALLLARAAAQAQGRDWPEARTPAREGPTGPRTPGIGLATLRGGEVVGEHTVFVFGDGERLELTHRAADRGIFAHGALRAAAWVAGRPPGHYSMGDLLQPPV